jgi:hypothetical protein
MGNLTPLLHPGRLPQAIGVKSLILARNFVAGKRLILEMILGVPGFTRSKVKTPGDPPLPTRSHACEPLN